MTNEEKTSILAEAMDVDYDALILDKKLSEFEEWDSLAALSLMSLLRSRLGKNATPNDIKNMITVADALSIME